MQGSSVSRASQRGQSASPHSFFCKHWDDHNHPGGDRISNPAAIMLRAGPWKRHDGHLATEVAANAGDSIIDGAPRSAAAAVGSQVCAPVVAAARAAAAEADHVIWQLPTACRQHVRVDLRVFIAGLRCKVRIRIPTPPLLCGTDGTRSQ